MSCVVPGCKTKSTDYRDGGTFRTLFWCPKDSKEEEKWSEAVFGKKGMWLEHYRQDSPSTCVDSFNNISKAESSPDDQIYTVALLDFLKDAPSEYVSESRFPPDQLAPLIQKRKWARLVAQCSKSELINLAKDVFHISMRYAKKMHEAFNSGVAPVETMAAEPKWMQRMVNQFRGLADVAMGDVEMEIKIAMENLFACWGFGDYVTKLRVTESRLSGPELYRALSQRSGLPAAVLQIYWERCLAQWSQQLRWSLAAGDVCSVPDADPAVLCGDITLLSQEVLQSRAAINSLTRLVHLAGNYHNTGQPSTILWAALVSTFTAQGFQVSELVLQRRWYECVVWARSAALRGQVTIPIPFVMILKRFHDLVTSPIKSWAWLLQNGRVYTARHLSKVPDIEIQKIIKGKKKVARAVQKCAPLPENLDFDKVQRDIIFDDDDDPPSGDPTEKNLTEKEKKSQEMYLLNETSNHVPDTPDIHHYGLLSYSACTGQNIVVSPSHLKQCTIIFPPNYNETTSDTDKDDNEIDIDRNDRLCDTDLDVKLSDIDEDTRSVDSDQYKRLSIDLEEQLSHAGQNELSIENINNDKTPNVITINGNDLMSKMKCTLAKLLKISEATEDNDPKVLESHVALKAEAMDDIDTIENKNVMNKRSESGPGRASKVLLQDIDSVRRINKGILTAQVAPITLADYSSKVSEVTEPISGPSTQTDRKRDTEGDSRLTEIILNRLNPVDLGDPVDPVKQLDPVDSVSQEDHSHLVDETVNIDQIESIVDHEDPANSVDRMNHVELVKTNVVHMKKVNDKNPVDPAKPLCSKEPMNPVDPVNQAELVDTMDSDNQIEHVNPVGTVNQDDYVTPVDSLGHIGKVNQVDFLEPLDSENNVEHVKSAIIMNQVGHVDSINSADSLKHVNTVAHVDSVDQVNTLGNVGVVDKTDFVDPLKHVDLVDNVYPVNRVDQVVKDPLVDSMHLMEQSNPVDQVKLVDQVNPGNQVNPLDPVVILNHIAINHRKNTKTVKSMNIVVPMDNIVPKEQSNLVGQVKPEDQVDPGNQVISEVKLKPLNQVETMVPHKPSNPEGEVESMDQIEANKHINPEEGCNTVEPESQIYFIQIYKKHINTEDQTNFVDKVEHFKEIGLENQVNPEKPSNPEDKVEPMNQIESNNKINPQEQFTSVVFVGQIDQKNQANLGSQSSPVDKIETVNQIFPEIQVNLDKPSSKVDKVDSMDQIEPNNQINPVEQSKSLEPDDQIKQKNQVIIGDKSNPVNKVEVVKQVNPVDQVDSVDGVLSEKQLKDFIKSLQVAPKLPMYNFCCAANQHIFRCSNTHRNSTRKGETYYWPPHRHKNCGCCCRHFLRDTPKNLINKKQPKKRNRIRTKNDIPPPTTISMDDKIVNLSGEATEVQHKEWTRQKELANKLYGLKKLTSTKTVTLDSIKKSAEPTPAPSPASSPAPPTIVKITVLRRNPPNPPDLTPSIPPLTPIRSTVSMRSTKGPSKGTIKEPVVITKGLTIESTKNCSVETTRGATSAPTLKPSLVHTQRSIFRSSMPVSKESCPKKPIKRNESRIENTRTDKVAVGPYTSQKEFFADHRHLNPSIFVLRMESMSVPLRVSDRVVLVTTEHVPCKQPQLYSVENGRRLAFLGPERLREIRYGVIVDFDDRDVKKVHMMTAVSDPRLARDTIKRRSALLYDSLNCDLVPVFRGDQSDDKRFKLTTATRYAHLLGPLEERLSAVDDPVTIDSSSDDDEASYLIVDDKKRPRPQQNTASKRKKTS